MPSSYHVLRWPYAQIFFSGIGKSFSSRETTRAQTKYRKSNTSGLGVRALYRTMFPEISARWSLLEPTFRYLLSDREGEKCWSLNHAWQIPFFHSAQFIISSNFYIYGTLVPSSIVWALKEKQWRWAKTFCHLWKPSHFPNMKCFLQPFFAQNKPEMISE